LRFPLPITPAAWLSAPPKNPGATWTPKSILSCYCGAPAVYKYVGPCIFYRAAGLKADGRLADAYSGEWWVESAVLEHIYNKLAMYNGWLSPSELVRAASAQYRAITALCFNWNDMSEMCCLELPDRESVEGLAGAAMPQPAWSNRGLDPNDPRTPMLRGKGEQVFFKVKNPLWVEPVRPF